MAFRKRFLAQVKIVVKAVLNCRANSELCFWIFFQYRHCQKMRQRMALLVKIRFFVIRHLYGELFYFITNNAWDAVSFVNRTLDNHVVFGLQEVAICGECAGECDSFYFIAPIL